LRRLFPCSRFVLNARRELESTASSGFYRKRENGERIVQTLYGDLMKLNQPRDSYVLYMEDLNPGNFTVLSQWLGVDCTFSAIAHSNKNNSYRSGTAVPRRTCVEEAP
jgi:hypothetical protein